VVNLLDGRDLDARVKGPESICQISAEPPWLPAGDAFQTAFAIEYFQGGEVRGRSPPVPLGPVSCPDGLEPRE
jgi:hypothetical protein